MSNVVTHLKSETGPDKLAALLKAAGDSLRLKILTILSNNTFGALELSDILGVRQNALSHHLKLLTRAGLVTFRREGTHIFYRRNLKHPEYDRLQSEILSAADAQPLSAEITTKIAHIERARTAASREFFRVNADKFREQQDLIAGYAQYGKAVVTIVDDRPSTQSESVLEVGTGEGELLSDLHSQFNQVIALDNSAEMLARSKAFAERRALTNIDFMLGDTTALTARGQKFNVITLNMVLHHTPTPASVIADLSTVLCTGGSLIVTELCQHDQDWARTACGDLWLGFDPEELKNWAQDAGLNNTSIEYLPLKNGFCVQIHQFTPSTNH